MPRFESLKELVEAVRCGEVNEALLYVVMDNDCSSVYCASDEDEDEEALYCGKGYYDVEDLWPLVFPKAKVEWC